MKVTIDSALIRRRQLPRSEAPIRLTELTSSRMQAMPQLELAVQLERSQSFQSLNYCFDILGNTFAVFTLPV